MGGYHIETVGGGYDHNFVLQGADGDFIQAAAVYDELTGRAMEVFTTEPGVQFYSGTFINAHKGKYSRSYGPFSGFALETQHWPDAQNKRHFPRLTRANCAGASIIRGLRLRAGGFFRRCHKRENFMGARG